MKNKFSTNYIVKVAILAALASAIMFLEFIIPGMPIFLKLDFSEIPVLLGTFALGPLAGILIELVKNLIHLTMSITAGIGELANFIVGSAFLVPAGLIYKKHKTKKAAFIGLLVGSLSMILIATAANYFVLLPIYIKLYGLDTVIMLAQKGNEKITDISSLIVMGIIPFNTLKSFVLSLLTLAIYKKVSVLLHK